MENNSIGRTLPSNVFQSRPFTGELKQSYELTPARVRLFAASNVKGEGRRTPPPSRSTPDRVRVSRKNERVALDEIKPMMTDEDETP